MKGLPQISLRELLAMVLFAGLGLASLRTGGLIASITTIVAIVFLMCTAILAVVGRGQGRIFATGFLIPVVIYGGIVFAAGDKELDPYNGRLPTSRILQTLWPVLATQTWTDLRTGQVVPNYNPAVHGPMGGMGGMARAMSLETPDRPTFMSLGHILWATIFGYGGARFALAVYRQQQKESQNPRNRSDSLSS